MMNHFSLSVRNNPELTPAILAMLNKGQGGLTPSGERGNVWAGRTEPLGLVKAFKAAVDAGVEVLAIEVGKGEKNAEWSEALATVKSMTRETEFTHARHTTVTSESLGRT